jgi:putative tricarboxylic transport membrane protein
VRTRSPDFWSGLALAALGGYIVYSARGWEYLGQDGPGPGFFPLWYGITMLALSLVLVVKGKGEVVSWKGTGRAFATWAAFAVSVAFIKLAGFLICFAALTYFMVAVMYRRSRVTAAIVAASVAAGFYLVFPLALGVPLP